MLKIKSQEEIVEMLSFIRFFNDGKFMNQDYRKGILDALEFVLYYNNSLDKVKNHFKENSELRNNGKKQT